MGTSQVAGSWLHRLFVRRQQLERVLDELFAEAPWPVGMKVVLYNEVDAGLGDVAFMTKLIHLLAQPGGPSLVLVSTGLEKQRRFPLPDEVRVIAADDARGHEALEGCDLIISAPGIFDHCRRAEDVRAVLGLPERTPFLYLAEYGSIRQLRDDAFKTLLPAIEDARDRYLDVVAAARDVDPDDCGFRARTGEIVTVDDTGARVIGHLDALFFDPRGDHPLGPFICAPTLSARSCGLEDGELGVHVDTDLADAASAIAESPRRAEEIAATLEHAPTRARVLAALAAGEGVYQGYAHSGHAVFHDLLSYVEAGRGRPLLVVSPDRRAPDAVLAADFTSELVERLAARGFGGVRVVDGGAGERPPAEVERRWADGPVYSVWTTFPLPFPDMRRLLLVSEPWTMVSGDQSFSDAISADKAIGVIEPVYCQTFHLDATVALAGAIDPHYAALLEAGLQFSWSPAHLTRAFDGCEADRLLASARALSRRIRCDHNLNGAAMNAVRRALWTLAGDGQWLSPAVEAGLAELRQGRLPAFDALRGRVRAPWVDGEGP